ncbi:MAG: hypothetical protein FJ271_15855 [Planctomycetes bacterium]|nr:hypothetical protein [Planctomycetota bacterium]
MAYPRSMRIIDPATGKAYLENRRVRYNEPGQPRELTFSFSRRFAILNRERTRQWLAEASEQGCPKSGLRPNVQRLVTRQYNIDQES